MDDKPGSSCLSPRIDSIQYGVTDVESFAYDVAGNRVTHNSRSGEARTLEYDAGNQLIRTRVGGLEVERYVYDGAGRRRQRLDSSGTELEAYSCDALGRLTSYSSPSYSMTLTYDAPPPGPVGD